MTGKVVVGMTGASGAIYGVRFLELAARHFEQVFLIVSEHAVQVADTELERPARTAPLTLEWLLTEAPANITLLDRKDYFSPPASGSFRHDGMVIVPCSMGTIGRIAHGVSDDL